MRTQRMAIPIATMLLLLAAAAAGAGTLTGTVKVGGVFLDETGDLSTVQETYDLEEGFVLSRIQLAGTIDPRSSFLLDLRDLNVRSRAGNLAFRVPGTFKLTAGYDQNRHVFDPGRGITADRRDWRAGMQLTPVKWLALAADANYVTREGERLAFPAGTDGVLGDAYDHALGTGSVSADVRAGAYGGGLSFRMSDFNDEKNPAADRVGRVWTARFHAPMPFLDRWNNLFRASYGTREMRDAKDIEYMLTSFQYTSVLQPRNDWQLRYAFGASRVKDDALNLRTDRFLNDVDAAWLHRLVQLRAGYGYEMNDDDRTLTTYQSWRAGATVRPDKRISARVDYAGRVKTDEEELTLLKDVESSRLRAKLEVTPLERLTVGGDYAKREREFPDVGVKVAGEDMGAMLRWELPKWGALSGDFSHADDEYTDLLAGFHVVSDIVTARAEVGRIPNLTLAGGVTYLDIGEDLDIEKSVVFAEAALKLAERYRLEAKYNCYNYDDYILIDRYYTANVVRIELGYDLRP